MAYEQSLLTVTIPVNQSFASLQYTFVQVNSSGYLIPPSGQGVICDGVIQDDNPYTGSANTGSSVGISGISKVVSYGTVTAGDLVMTDASGRAITATTTNHILGRALAGNGAVNGAIIPGVSSSTRSSFTALRSMSNLPLEARRICPSPAVR